MCICSTCKLPYSLFVEFLGKVCYNCVKLKLLVLFFRRYEITFVDKSNTAESFTLEMSLKSNYMEMATKVGQRLGVNPLFVQFYRSQPYK